MRYAGFVAAALIILSCGPDPNATLPQIEGMSKGGSGGSGQGGKSVEQGGSGGAEKGGNGGQSRAGGRVGSGGSEGSGGVTEEGTGGRFGRGTGGSTAIGGRTGTGGRVGGTGGRVGGTGGRFGALGGAPGTGGRIGPAVDGGGGVSTAACANAKPISQSVSFNTTSEFCFVTCDQTVNGWGCDSFTTNERTVKVNGKVVKTCGETLPAQKDGYYYFEIGPGGNTWDAIHVNGPKATTCPTPPGGFSP
jgi:hypothetical protein